MTVTLRPRIECDECGEQTAGEYGENVFDMRAKLKSAGWSTPESDHGYGQKDFCPACTAARRFLRT